MNEYVWHADNLAYLRSILTPQYLRDKLEQAMMLLEGTRAFPLAATVVTDAHMQQNGLADNIALVLTNLAKPYAERKWS